MPRAEVRISGRLDARWTEWFEGFEFAYTEAGETILTGTLPDQAAIYGLIAKLRDLGVQLISVYLDRSIESQIQSRDPTP